MDWIEVSQLGVSIVGFGAVIIQLTIVNRRAKSAARATIYDLGARVKQNLVDYPELHPYFFEGRDISPEDEHFARVTAFTDLFCLYMENIAVQSRDIQKPYRESWSDFITHHYAHSPIVKGHLDRHKKRYSPAMWKIIEKSQVS